VVRRPALARSVQKLRANRLVVVCLGILFLVTALSVVGPLASPHSLEAIAFNESFLSPTLIDGRLFGTDDLGRDLFVRTLKGTQVTLLVALVASIVSLVIGVLYGAFAGFAGGKTDAFMMRAVDALYAINWLDTARIVRGQTMSLKQRAFVDAARLTGVSTAGILFRHIAPNLISVVVVYITLTIPQVILFESFLSFLGLGVQEPQTSLGALVSNGVSRMEVAPWMLLIPASFLALILLCFNFLGDGLRDLLDPKSRV